MTTISADWREIAGVLERGGRPHEALVRLIAGPLDLAPGPKWAGGEATDLGDTGAPATTSCITLRDRGLDSPPWWPACPSVGHWAMLSHGPCFSDIFAVLFGFSVALAVATHVSGTL